MNFLSILIMGPEPQFQFAYSQDTTKSNAQFFSLVKGKFLSGTRAHVSLPFPRKSWYHCYS